MCIGAELIMQIRTTRACFDLQIKETQQHINIKALPLNSTCLFLGKCFRKSKVESECLLVKGCRHGSIRNIAAALILSCLYAIQLNSNGIWATYYTLQRPIRSIIYLTVRGLFTVNKRNYQKCCATDIKQKLKTSSLVNES